MEVEVKVRLFSAVAYDAVRTLFGEVGRFLRTDRQENVFFDGAKGELSAQRAALRFRFVEGDDTCLVTLKERARIEGGIMRAGEIEERMPTAPARTLVDHPTQIFDVATKGSTTLLAHVCNTFHPHAFVSLGGFHTTRDVFQWREWKVEVDQVLYAFGTMWGIEIETSQPDEARRQVNDLLTSRGIHHADEVATKFAYFRHGCFELPERADS